MPVPNVMPISGTNAIKAAQLCNMPTGLAALLIDHQNWLDNEVQKVIRGMQGPWVILKPYASHRGDTRGYNIKPSPNTVALWLRTASPSMRTASTSRWPPASAHRRAPEALKTTKAT